MFVVILITILSSVVASAALLEVNGGSIQVFEYTLSINIATLTPTPPALAGTSLKAAITAEGFVHERDGNMVSGVRGEVCVENDGDDPTLGLEILDTLQYKDSGEKFADFFVTPLEVNTMPVLEARMKYCYPYEIIFGPVSGDKIKYRNTVSVTILNHSGWLPGGPQCSGPDPCPFGPEPNATFGFDADFVDEPGSDVVEQPEPSPTEIPTVEITGSPTEVATVEPSPTPIPTLPPDAMETVNPSPEPSPTPAESGIVPTP